MLPGRGKYEEEELKQVRHKRMAYSLCRFHGQGHLDIPQGEGHLDIAQAVPSAQKCTGSLGLGSELESY